MPRKLTRLMYLAAGLCGTCPSRAPVDGQNDLAEPWRASGKAESKMKPSRTLSGTGAVQEKANFTWNRVLDHYGRFCACCGEITEQFLSLDHMNNDGASHRRQVRGHNGGTVYAWLVKNGFPEGFQILCYNCNFAKGRYGICPHEATRTSERLAKRDGQQTQEFVPDAESNAVPMLLN